MKRILEVSQQWSNDFGWKFCFRFSENFISFLLDQIRYRLLVVFILEISHFSFSFSFGCLKCICSSRQIHIFGLLLTNDQTMRTNMINAKNKTESDFFSFIFFQKFKTKTTVVLWSDHKIHRIPPFGYSWAVEYIFYFSLCCTIETASNSNSNIFYAVNSGSAYISVSSSWTKDLNFVLVSQWFYRPILSRWA